MVFDDELGFELGSDWYKCPFNKDPDICTCSTCFLHNEMKRGKAQLKTAWDRNFGRDGTVFGVMKAPEPPPEEKETPREKYERQKKARYQETEKSWSQIQKKTEVPKFDLDEVLANPELDAVEPVKLDPASMLADDIESLAKEGKEFINNPTLAGAASMAVIAIPGKFADKIIPDDAIKLVTNHSNAHSLARHGGDVTDEQLMTRALTGLAPDGKVKEVKGKVILPPMSSAFHSNDLLLYADQEIRKKGGILEKKIKESNSNILTVRPDDMDSFELDLGRGFKRIGKSKYQPDLQGPVEMVKGLDKVQATYELNKSNGVWETITIFPSK
ncbi:MULTISPECIES: hypothetical protein [Vibrio]|uniref:Uncharacterized protein n=1 Tax=Vibrio parahaemolyticus TaxID=670 RepID=A0AA47JN86_VIBPH|nr:MULTISPECIES: hypothetical protein [Vibrio]MCZ6249642.1 hypothetical protein [Vibrio parahaemolyticus]MCZ6279385.1 hypothetical protein [Vibrio parahaemolyticus]MCZ6417413.1 hypothetical protein [Vibrio parahaemolyticus]MCZ6422380.1 hypothetical protein [Vibrio parahaemolyticus]MDE0552426.1 hypothetical protein [Vibrio sp. VP6]